MRGERGGSGEAYFSEPEWGMRSSEETRRDEVMEGPRRKAQNRRVLLWQDVPGPSSEVVYIEPHLSRTSSGASAVEPLKTLSRYRTTLLTLCQQILKKNLAELKGVGPSVSRGVRGLVEFNLMCPAPLRG